MGEEKSKLVEYPVGDIGIPQWQTGLARAVNETYNYNVNGSLWSGLLPTYMKDYAWRYVRPALQWLDGYVYSLHSAEGDTGIISTRIGNVLISGLTKQLVGEKIIVKINEEKPNDQDKQNLKKACEWILKNKLIAAVYAGIGFSEAVGTSLLKENHSMYGEVWWEAVRFDQCVYRTNFRGDVEDAIFLIRGYTDTTQSKTNTQFFLVEHRFYEVINDKHVAKNPDGTYKPVIKHEVKPKVEYLVKKVRGTMNNGGADAPTISETATVKWEQLPEWLRKALRDDYGAIRVGEPQDLGFDYIGVECLLDSYIDLAHPKANNLGESKLIKIQSDMITYEVAASYKIRDMYLGKGTVYMPKSLSLGDVSPNAMQFRSGMSQNVLSNVGDKKIELMKGVDPALQKAIVEQFELRSEQWQAVMDDSIRNIATKWGMSPKVLSSYLLNSQTSMTATQIDSEDDISIAFINHERSYFREPINKLLESSLNYMGIATNISMNFASPSLINKDRVIDRQIKLLDAGLTTEDDCIREIYPDLEEEQICKKINEAKAQRDQKAMQEINEMNNDGTFGNDNNYDDLGGKNLFGSTEPVQ